MLVVIEDFDVNDKMLDITDDFGVMIPHCSLEGHVQLCVISIKTTFLFPSYSTQHRCLQRE